MSTSLDKLNEVILSKILTKEEMDKIIIETKPEIIKQLKKNLLNAINLVDFNEALQEAFQDRSYDIAESLVKQVDVSMKLKKVKK